ncbi:basic leucine zipper transcriptional factor ATF-like 3 [Suricata suricatta]|uniref:basic leucine zipper transcriptional factor ATF-like 3 n=1 Tax=Suricata suricatta TaxID=37032 RepID=UPI0011552BC0|nr:basic leucine zipper transcriptional factor ATF-like 3 [Suricata suricatta]
MSYWDHTVAQTSSGPSSQKPLGHLPPLPVLHLQSRRPVLLGGQAGTARAGQARDRLHEEYECLEQENTVLRREIGKLTAELQQLSEALKEHEKMCPLLLCPMNFMPVPRPDPVAGCLPR